MCRTSYSVQTSDVAAAGKISSPKGIQLSGATTGLPSSSSKKITPPTPITVSRDLPQTRSLSGNTSTASSSTSLNDVLACTPSMYVRSSIPALTEAGVTLQADCPVKRTHSLPIDGLRTSDPLDGIVPRRFMRISPIFDDMTSLLFTSRASGTFMEKPTLNSESS